ncbi:MAG: glycosyltransferase [Bacteroidota bacterium]|nr:glycosyltransferase [Bacteroidota bacterium]
MNPKLSIVIAVYNKPQNLRYVLEAFNRQSMKDFELIIADDGSGKELTDVVNEAKRTYPFRIKHLWHADNGWRKNTMLNYGIQESATDYIVFIDGDCLPGKDFVLDHFAHRVKEKILLGRRVEHGERWAKNLSLEKIRSGEFEKYTLRDIVDGLTGKSVTLEAGFRITHPFVRKLTGEVSSILGCNFSTYKEHLVAVNGFDESYDGPGSGEDSDIFYRLQLIGVTGKSLRSLALQYHIWHPLTKEKEANHQRFLAMKSKNEPRCKNGLMKL